MHVRWFGCVARAAAARELETPDVVGHLDHFGLVSRIRQCWTTKSLDHVKELHQHIVTAGEQHNRHLANVLIVAYGKCGRVEEATSVFNAIQDPNVFSWTVLIAAFAQNGLHAKSVHLFKCMCLQGVRANQVTFITLLGACSATPDALHVGRTAHRCIAGSPFESFPALQTALLDMYGKFGKVKEARSVFDQMVERDVVAWSAMLGANARAGESHEAMQVYHRMSLQGVKPNEVTFIALAEACSGLPTYEERQLLQEHVSESGYGERTIVGNSLVNMFGKCGDVAAARDAFRCIRHKDVVSWSVIISSFTQSPEDETGDEGLVFFKHMLLEGVSPNNATLVNCLDVCMKLADGREVHSVVKSMGVDSSPVVATAVLSMYSRCGSLPDAREVFEIIPLASRDVVTWTAMLSAYQQEFDSQRVLELFRCMDLNGVRPNEITLVTALLGCTSLTQGKLLHKSIAGTNFETDVVLGNNLVSFYGRHGSVEDAKSVFDGMREKSLNSWNALLSGYSSSSSRCKEILEVFHVMELEGVKGDEVSYMRILGSFVEAGMLSECGSISSRIVALGLDSRLQLSNLLITSYGQCGSLCEAARVFERMKARNLITWTAVIAAYAQHGHSREALEFYQRMDLEGIKPDDVTYLTILFACSHSGMLHEGRRYFLSMVGDHEVESCVKHYDCLVDLLGRAGWLEQAEELVKLIPFGDSLIAWTSLLGSCKTHRDWERAERTGRRIAELDPDNDVLSSTFSALV